MKIDKFDTKNLDIVRAKIQTALDNIDLEGVDFTLGSIRYSDSQMTVKITTKTLLAKLNESVALQDALLANGINETEGNGYTIVDYHPRKRKYPFIVEGPQGGSWKMNARQVKHRLGLG